MSWFWPPRSRPPFCGDPLNWPWPTPAPALDEQRVREIVREEMAAVQREALEAARRTPYCRIGTPLVTGPSVISAELGGQSDA